MGPLFSLGLLTVLAGLAMGVLFAIARIFLPTRAALVLAMLLIVAGVVGCILGLLIQLPFVGDSLVSSSVIARFFLVILASGGASAVGVLWIFLRWRTSQLRRVEAHTFD
jgi:hypothetical protein